MPKMILKAKMEGDRKRGRPKKRWINDVEQDLRKSGIRNWRSRAGDRQQWRAVVREAKVHPGLLSWRSSPLTHLAEGLCLNALLTLTVENSVICLVGTREST
jgi:hypothetical protein